MCFCTPDGQPNCSYELPTVHAKKGGSFSIYLVAVDQVNHTLKNVQIYSSLIHAGNNLGEGQTTQATRNVCTNLTFSIFSLHASDELILYAEGPCKNTSRSQRRVYIVFQPCTCPTGFQQKFKDNDCVCTCDSRLTPYFTEADNNCEFQNESLARHGNFWIGYINHSRSTSDKDIGSVNSSGFLIYPYCPLDYCLPPNSDVHINLNALNGADAQCASNRSGLLCSHRQPGHSLSLGSSRCIPCSKEWYKEFVPILATFMLAGILLVAFLMMLNLTSYSYWNIEWTDILC